MVAASSAPLNYVRWTKHGEVRAFAEFRRLHPRSGQSGQVIALLFDEDAGIEASNVSRRSIRAALGDVPIYSRTSHSGEAIAPPSPDLADTLSVLAKRHPAAWLLPVRAGDELSEAAGEIISRLPPPGHAGLAYWDEDLILDGARSDPWIKPDWDPILFGSRGGLAGASVVSLEAASLTATSSLPVSQAALEQLLLRLCQGQRPHHVPLILTHRGRPIAWRDQDPRPEASPVSWPSVSIVIPTRDKPELLAACLRGIEQTDYPGGVQTIIVDNGSRDPEALRLLDEAARGQHVIVLRDSGDFNFSRLNNCAAAAAQGEFLCLLNNDVEPLDRHWLSSLVAYANQEGIGAVGALLLYPSGRIQHAGVAIGLGGAAGHVQKGVDPSDRRFWTWHGVTREVSAVTAAVMVLKKKIFVEVGGFDEGAFPVAFNDVDLCLRLRQRGLRNLYIAEVRLLHRESESRGDDQAPAQAHRFASELATLRRRWNTEDYCDPFFNPLFSRLVERCVLEP